MGISLITYAGSTVTSQDDALVYETALNQSGMIYGAEVTLDSANVLHVAAGHGVLCGRKFTIEATDVAVALTATGTLNGRLYIHMDLSDIDEPISFRTQTAETITDEIQQSNVNINSGIYEIRLANFTVDTATISNLVQVTPYITHTEVDYGQWTSTVSCVLGATTALFANPYNSTNVAIDPYNENTSGTVLGVTSIAVTASTITLTFPELEEDTDWKLFVRELS